MNKGKKSKIGIYLAIIAVFFTGYFVYTFVKQQNALYIKNNEKKQIEAKIEEQNRMNQQMKKQLENVNSDEHTEKIAREKLGMVKQGEKIFVDVNN